MNRRLRLCPTGGVQTRSGQTGRPSCSALLRIFSSRLSTAISGRATRVRRATLAITIGLASAAFGTTVRGAAGPDIRITKQEPGPWTPAQAEFRSFYGWDDAVGTWSCRLVDVPSGGEVALHLFESKGSDARRGTLFLLHGYLEHAALRAPLAAEWVAGGWQVVGVDLPGHGLSSGPRAEIDDFQDYAEALEAVLSVRDWPRPLVAVGHSLGAATLLLAAQQRGNPFEWTVLEAPLIRSYLWNPSRLAMELLGDVIESLPRRAAGLSRESAFYHRLTRDPMYIDRVPTSWFEALEGFVGQIDRWGPIEGNFVVLQGTEDTVVDARFNLPFLREVLPGAEIIMISGGHHHLLMDEGPAGREVGGVLRKRFLNPRSEGGYPLKQNPAGPSP